MDQHDLDRGQRRDSWPASPAPTPPAPVPSPLPPMPVPPTTTRRGTNWPAVLMGVVIAGLVWVTGSTSAGNGAFGTTGIDRPTASEAESDTPLGVPRYSPLDGPHRFTAVQPGSDRPVAYDPCRPVTYVVNARTAPPEGARLLEEAVAEVSAATGLRFVAEGATDEGYEPDRPGFLPDRYGDRWAPVLVNWSDPAEAPRLDGTIAGIGGSTWLTSQRRFPWLPVGGTAPDVYVSGSITLDGPQLTELLARRGGADDVRGVIMHELAHLVGLAHVDDASQLMNEESTEANRFQGGDLAGLAALGRGACIPKL